jgi:hypothetical protein
MSSFDAMAASGVTSFGGPVTLRKVTQGPYNATTRIQPPPTTTDYPALGRLEDQVVEDESGRMVQTDKKKLVLLAQSLPPGIVPAKTDFAIVAGVQYTILKINVDAAQNSPFAYPLEVQA